MVLSKKVLGNQTRQEKLAALHSKLWVSAQKPRPKAFNYEQKGPLAVYTANQGGQGGRMNKQIKRQHTLGDEMLDSD